MSRLDGDRGAGLRRRARPARRADGEHGYILLMTAFMMIPILLFTAFAVDLGSWYAQSSRMQRAVDAAALAGVVQLPNTADAEAAANAALDANHFSHLVYIPTFDYPISAGVEMTVTISVPADQYFSKPVIESLTLSRTATAIYNLRIPLGSPANAFGNNLPAGCTDPVAACAGAQPNLWAAINGPYSSHSDGDPYSTKCATTASSSTTCSGGANGVNRTYRKTGFLWAVDVPESAVGSPVVVSVYDPALGPNAALSENYSGSIRTGFVTSYQMFDYSGSDASIDLAASNGMDSLGMCSGGTLGYKKFSTGSTSGAIPTPNSQYTNAWYPLCTFTPQKAGIYPMQVKSSAIPGVTDKGSGWNGYAVRAVSGSGTQPQTFAMSDMGVWTPTPATTAKFYLSSVGTDYAGHSLVIDLFDPGDGQSGDYFLSVLAPPGGAPTNPPPGGTSTPCAYSLPTATIGGATTEWSPTCTVQTRNSAASTPNKYNNGWLRISIALPNTYSCTTDCWWTVSYAFNNTSSGSPPSDRTVWVVNVVGDPVHLMSS